MQTPDNWRDSTLQRPPLQRGNDRFEKSTSSAGWGQRNFPSRSDSRFEAPVQSRRGERIVSSLDEPSRKIEAAKLFDLGAWRSSEGQPAPNRSQSDVHPRSRADVSRHHGFGLPRYAIPRGSDGSFLDS